MTRSSWHYFWMLMTGLSIILFGVFCYAAMSSSPAPEPSSVMSLDQIQQAVYQSAAQWWVVRLSVFWGFAAVICGLAWFSCARALAARKRLLAVAAITQSARSVPDGGQGIDVELRA